MSLTTPLKRATGLGSAHAGVHHWWMQRVTALANIPLVLFFIYSSVRFVGADYADYQAWMAHPLTASLHVLLVISVFYHATMGLQVVYEDYLSDETARRAADLATKAAAAVLATVSVFSILKLAFGG